MLNGKLYALGGWEGMTNSCISSIEILDVESQADAWVLFNYDHIIGRESPIISPLNENQMLIAGGSKRKKTSGNEYILDAYIL